MIDRERMVGMLEAICGSGGDENELYREMTPILAAQGYEMLLNYDLAREFAHDVLAEVYINPEKYAALENPFNYIYGSYIHRVMNNQRDTRSHPSESLDGVTDVADTLSVEERVEHRMVIDSMMSLLSKEERVIVALRMYSDLSHTDIADILEIPATTVRSKYVRSLEKVGKFWETRKKDGKGE